MCIGIPMQVVRCEEHRALCVSGSDETWVDLSLLGPQPKDTWVLVFLGAAREVLTEARAAQVQDALGAVAAVMEGQTDALDHLFADLVGREPELPEHLRKK